MEVASHPSRITTIPPDSKACEPPTGAFARIAASAYALSDPTSHSVSSGAHPAANDTVSFDYEGKLTTGETFDSSYTEGHPLVGQVNKFVPGFSEALQLMRPGDEWIVWIPPTLGYGAKEVGPIPANSVLRFKLVLHSVTPAA